MSQLRENFKNSFTFGQFYKKSITFKKTVWDRDILVKNVNELITEFLRSDYKAFNVFFRDYLDEEFENEINARNYMCLVFSSLERHTDICFEVKALKLLLSVKFAKKIFEKWNYIRMMVIKVAKVNHNEEKKFQLLREVFLTRDHYKYVADKVKKGYSKELQKWVESVERGLKKRRRRIRHSRKREKVDKSLERKSKLFLTELTSGSPVALRLLEMVMGSELTRSERRKDKEKVERKKKKKIIKEILRLEKQGRKKKMDLMMLIAFMRNLDPFFIRAKKMVVSAKERLDICSNFVKGEKNVEKMENFIGKKGMELLKNDSEIKVNIFKKLSGDLDRENLQLAQGLKSSQFHNFFTNHRNLVHQLVKMNHPLFRKKFEEIKEEEIDEKPEEVKEIILEVKEEPKEEELAIDLIEEIEESLKDPTPPPSPPRTPTPPPISPPREPSPAPPMEEKIPVIEPDFTAEEVKNDILKYINQYRINPNSAINDIENKKKSGSEIFKGDNTETNNFLQNLEPLGELGLDENLSNSAKDHCPDLIEMGKCSKKGLDGSMPIDRVKRYGKAPKVLDESLSLGLKSGQDVVLSLISDAGERGKVFGNDFKILGLHVEKKSDGTFACVIDFGSDEYEIEEEEKVAEEEIVPEVKDEKKEVVEEIKEEEETPLAEEIKEPEKEEEPAPVEEIKEPEKEEEPTPVEEIKELEKEEEPAPVEEEPPIQEEPEPEEDQAQEVKEELETPPENTEPPEVPKETTIQDEPPQEEIEEKEPPKQITPTEETPKEIAPAPKAQSPPPEEESEDEGFPSLEAMLGSTNDEFGGLIGERAKYETEVLGIDENQAARAEDFELKEIKEEGDAEEK